jgi:hypothetical protein
MKTAQVVFDSITTRICGCNSILAITLEVIQKSLTKSLEIDKFVDGTFIVRDDTIGKLQKNFESMCTDNNLEVKKYKKEEEMKYFIMLTNFIWNSLHNMKMKEDDIHYLIFVTSDPNYLYVTNSITENFKSIKIIIVYDSTLNYKKFDRETHYSIQDLFSTMISSDFKLKKYVHDHDFGPICPYGPSKCSSILNRKIGQDKMNNDASNTKDEQKDSNSSYNHGTNSNAGPNSNQYHGKYGNTGSNNNNNHGTYSNTGPNSNRNRGTNTGPNSNWKYGSHNTGHSGKYYDYNQRNFKFKLSTSEEDILKIHFNWLSDYISVLSFLIVQLCAKDHKMNKSSNVSIDMNRLADYIVNRYKISETFYTDLKNDIKKYLINRGFRFTNDHIEFNTSMELIQNIPIFVSNVDLHMHIMYIRMKQTLSLSIQQESLFEYLYEILNMYELPKESAYKCFKSLSFHSMKFGMKLVYDNYILI